MKTCYGCEHMFLTSAANPLPACMRSHDLTRARDPETRVAELKAVAAKCPDYELIPWLEENA